MERLRKETSSGLTANALRTWGMLFLACGIIGRSILQNRLLGIQQLSNQQLLEAMTGSQFTMIVATAALVLQAIETLAVPIFAFLLVEGFAHTKSKKMYLLRLLGAALLSELPYNLAMSGKVLDLSSRNPVFGLVIAIVLLYFCQHYEEKKLQNILIKVFVFIAAILWIMMLIVKDGIPIIVLVTVLWALRKKPQFRCFAGACAAIACSILSPFYVASPMGFLPVHLYDGEQGSYNRLTNYLSYPVLLLVIGLIAIFVF